MVFANANEIKRLINNQNASATLINDAITAGDKEAVKLSGRNDWNQLAHPVIYGAIQNLANLYAAWSILISYDKEEYLDKAKEIRSMYEQAVKDFKDMHLPDDMINPNFFIAESEYTVPPLNPEADYYMSTY